MHTKNATVAMVLMAVGSALYAAYLYPSLPDPIPIHWNIHGQPDGWGPKWTALVFMPGLILCFTALMLALPGLSPKNASLRGSTPVFNLLMVMVGLFLVFTHVLTLQAALHPTFDLTRPLVSAIFLLFAFMGNVIGKVRLNYWAGVRTPWTLSSERVWKATHRAAGRLWVVTGIAGAILAALGMPLIACFVFLMVVAFIPVVHSYILYRQIEG